LRLAAGDRAHLATKPSVVSLQAMRAIMQRGEAGAQDGLLHGLIARTRLPGLTADSPISASRLGTLLSCPHRHLYENVLYFRPPSGPLPSHELNALSFGSLLHAVAEAFYNEHGTDFGARKHDLAFYQRAMRYRGEDAFRQFCESYPFANERIAEAQGHEFLDQLSKLLDYDWQGAPRAFVAVERGFGYDEPCALDTDAGRLYVRGRIDRIDVEHDAVLVRDLKTGRSKPRRADDPPSLNPDLQLGLYARVTQRLAPSWGLAPKVGVAYVYLRSGELERRWSGADYDQLQAASGEWLATAVDILEHGAFVRTAARSDCQYCAHKMVCESEHHRTQDVLNDPRVPHRLRVLKTGDAP
jgi:RecB family exonuclease